MDTLPIELRLKIFGISCDTARHAYISRSKIQVEHSLSIRVTDWAGGVQFNPDLYPRRRLCVIVGQDFMQEKLLAEAPGRSVCLKHYFHDHTSTLAFDRKMLTKNDDGSSWLVTTHGPEVCAHM